MTIKLDHVFKRFVRTWIIEDFSYTFHAGKVYGIKGQNGSGKSTLLRIISGALPPSKGDVIYHLKDQQLIDSEIYRHLSYYAAGDDLIEEYTADELYDHYYSFKKTDISKSDFFERVDLSKHKHKALNTFSAGMRQRMALGLCMFCNSSILLLDEPTSYLDKSKRDWFYSTLETTLNRDRIVIIASNDDDDFNLCDEFFEV